ncbi:uncharacterized protein LOC135350121 [Halichondria panicea]|uniref:uncharacterized protein LOC135350121 n=1 Tax=Halichondria panicea TaxID=6063 RepID=UPI00312B8A04
MLQTSLLQAKLPDLHPFLAANKMKWCIALLSAFLACCAAQPSNPCQDSTISSLPFCDYNLTTKDRVIDLLGRLTPAEKISQLGHGAPAIDRLKIPAYQWWSEALHGVAKSPGVHFGGKVPVATSFPQILGIAAAYNMSLVRSMAEVISTEARAMYNVGQAGLTFFAPNVNIFRDPRWGRGQETPGEDPYLASQYAMNFVKGMQVGDDYRYIKAAVCCKHFAAYDLENWNGTDRHHFNAIVTDQDLVETYFPAFESCVREGSVASIMCSYNAVNGVPSCANDLIQNKVTRDQWGFQGFIVSDCGAISNIQSAHMYTNNTDDTVQVALRGGTDLNCGGFYQKYAMDAYNNKKITDADLDLAVGRLFAFRIALGMFDPHETQNYWKITPDQVNSQAHQELALDASRESIVLLQNNNKALPIDKKMKVTLIGPNANATNTMKGNYNGNAPYLISPLEGLQKLGVSVSYAMGCDVKCASNSGFAEAVTAAKSADVVVFVIGLDQSQESEGRDRDDISLPGMQEQLLDTVKKSISSNIPVIVALMSGSSVDISWALSNADAVMWVGYPGQSGGQAMAEILVGMVNPSGRLPFTMYPKDYVNQISMFDMSMRISPGRSYKFYTGTPVFHFGDGLSYTTFSYKWSASPTVEEAPVQYSKSGGLVVSRESLRRAQIDYEVEVTNTGSRGGAVSVLAFMTSSEQGAPMKQLFDFQKVYLEAGGSVKLFFAATERDLSLVDEQGKKELNAGQYLISIGELEHRVDIV